MYIEKVKLKKRKRIGKRVFDIIFSLIGIIVLLPILLIVAIAIKVDSTGPIIFKQERIGAKGKPFFIFKFRTMVHQAEKKGKLITVGRDSRITRVGHFIRKYKIDEIPQLINVLKGDMSFVGPRPEVPKYVELYDNNQMEILLVKPGITDYASIKYRDESNILSKSDNPEETYINEIMPIKLKLNKQYIDNISLLEDIKIILKTIIVVLR